MDEEIKDQVNIDNDGSEGMSQEKFADLFRSLDEAYLNDMLERAGMSEETPADGGNADGAVADEISADAGDDTAGGTETPVSAEDQAVTAAVPGGELGPEHIGHLLKMLGEDIINDMLQDAGLEDEALQSDDSPEAEVPETPLAGPGGNKDPERRRRRRRGKLKRSFLLLAIFAGIALMVFAVNQISMNVTINSDDPIQYSEQADEISALEGSLIVNDVSVSVPTGESEEYSISYAWAEDDEKYPSVPKAITAVYPGEEGEKLYTISLYRSETIKKKDIPKGKKASNWFDDWETVTEGDVLQKPLKSGSINGFYIFPQMSEDGAGTASGYNDYSYYFAVKERGGISIYIIEGVCLDESNVTAFSRIMDTCIKSITINNENKDKEEKEKTEETDSKQA